MSGPIDFSTPTKVSRGTECIGPDLYVDFADGALYLYYGESEGANEGICLEQTDLNRLIFFARSKGMEIPA